MSEILTPVGRIVQGILFKGNTTNQKGQLLTDKSGNPREEFYLNLALPKTEASTQEFINQLQQIAIQEFPNQEYNKPDFNWKIIDGDTRSDKVGFAGHMIVKFKTGFMVPVYKSNGTGFTQLVSADQVKVGDWVRIKANVNKCPDPAGLYMNHQMIEHVGYGEAITNAPAPGSVFTQPAVLPQGVSQTPVGAAVAPMAPMAPAAPMAPMAPVQQQVAPTFASMGVGVPLGQPAAPVAHAIGNGIIDPNNI